MTGGGIVRSNPAGIDCGSDCSENYISGTSVTLSATPDSGWSFGGWGGACTGTGVCTVSMNSAKSVSVSFDTATLIGIIQGHVRDETTGAPIIGTNVSVRSVSTGTVVSQTTLENGSFIFLLGSGTYTVTATANGYQTKSLPGITSAPGRVSAVSYTHLTLPTKRIV